MLDGYRQVLGTGSLTKSCPAISVNSSGDAAHSLCSYKQTQYKYGFSCFFHTSFHSVIVKMRLDNIDMHKVITSNHNCC